MSVETKLTIEAPDKVTKGEKFNVTGTLTRKDTGEALDGMPVDLYVNGIKAASTTTVKGAYSFEVTINELKSHTVKSVFPGYTTRGKINVRAYADGTEVKVRVKGQYPAGEWDTPFSIELEEGVVATFVAPTSIVVNGSPYGLTAVEGGSWMGDGTFKAVCPANVSLKYSRTPAKWRWSGGEGSYLEVFDAAYKEERISTTVRVDRVDLVYVGGICGTYVLKHITLTVLKGRETRLDAVDCDRVGGVVVFENMSEGNTYDAEVETVPGRDLVEFFVYGTPIEIYARQLKEYEGKTLTLYSGRLKKSVYTKFSFVPGRDYRAVAVIWLDTPNHGYLLERGLTGYQEKEYSIDADLYALEFDVQPAWGGYAPVITIRKEEMRSY